MSGIQIMRQGHVTVIKDDKMVVCSDAVVPKESTIFATGKIDNTIGLLKLDNIIDPRVEETFTTLSAKALQTLAEQEPNIQNQNNNPKIKYFTMKELHENFGHVGLSTILRQLKHNPNIQVRGPRTMHKCETSLISRTRKKNINKSTEHIESEGIIKRKSVPYLHHFPGPAENANNHILYSAKGKPKASKLPLKFYSDAILDFSYLRNRIIHTGDIITP